MYPNSTNFDKNEAQHPTNLNKQRKKTLINTIKKHCLYKSLSYSRSHTLRVLRLSLSSSVVSPSFRFLPFIQSQISNRGNGFGHRNIGVHELSFQLFQAQPRNLRSPLFIWLIFFLTIFVLGMFVFLTMEFLTGVLNLEPLLLSLIRFCIQSHVGPLKYYDPWFNRDIWILFWIFGAIFFLVCNFIKNKKL